MFQSQLNIAKVTQGTRNSIEKSTIYSVIYIFPFFTDHPLVTEFTGIKTFGWKKKSPELEKVHNQKIILVL